MKNELNLPIIKKNTPKSKKLSMDEYLEFVNFGREINSNQKKSAQKISQSVNVKFSL